MRSIPVWAALAQLLLLGLTMQLGGVSSATSAAATQSSAAAWQRALFGRNSRNFLQRNNPAVQDTMLGSGIGGTFVVANKLNNPGYEFDQLFTPLNMELKPQQAPQQPLASALRHQQTEVYGIVEPLIEDTPCANRACLLNDDCCPTGVCVNTYGEGKCVYNFGRQRDLCQSHADCAAGSTCMLAPQEGIWRCEAEGPLLQDVYNVRPKQPLGSECSSSSDCQVVNGICCQRQRLHHRSISKLTCGYFRDAFDCVDVGQEHRRN